MPKDLPADLQNCVDPAAARERDREWLEAILAVTRSLLADAGENPLAAVACAIKKVSQSDFALVLLPVGNRGLMVEAAVGDGTEHLPGYSYSRTGSIAGPVLERGEPVLIADARHSASAALSLLSEEIDIGPVMFVPLPGRIEGRGVLLVGRRPGREPFGKRDVDPAVTFANHATLVLELADGRKYLQRVVLLEERNRIAGELHDQVLQRLFATGMSMQAIAAEAGPTCSERISRLIDATDETIARIRTVIQDLNQVDPDLRVR